MPEHDPVEQLLLRWKELRDQGQNLSPEDLCRADPALLEQFRQRLELCLFHEKLAQAHGNAATSPLLPANLSDSNGTIAADVASASKRRGPMPLPVIPGYDIVMTLGIGGMGVVYKARHQKLDRVVALKMILAGSHANEDALARFRREAEAIARLQHPNIVQIFEVGEHNGQPFFSLEYCDGGSLETRLTGTPLPPATAAQLTETLARAVHFAHERKIIHRDLKPANILLSKIEERSAKVEARMERGKPRTSLLDLRFFIPKITDFGLAKKQDQSLGLTQDRAMMGTPSYMSPEQASGETRSAGPESDIYSLGAILYECLTGRPPFKAANSWETVTQVISDDPAAPRRLQSNVPRDLETICLKCLQKDPRKRFASAQELADDLHRLTNGEPIHARPVGILEKAVKWTRRRPAIAGLLATLLLVVALAVGLIGWEYGEMMQQRDLANRKAYDAEQNEKEALRQKKIAEDNSSKLKKALEKVQSEAQRADTALLAIELKSAHDSWRAGDVGLTLEKLHDCAGPICGWEHRYLLKLCSQRMQEIKGHQGDILAVAFSPDGKTFAAAGRDAAGRDNTIRIYPTQGGKVRVLEKHTDAVTCLAFSPNGKLLASGSRDLTILAWDLQAGAVAHVLKGSSALVNSVAFSADSKQVAAGAADGSIRLWQVAGGKYERTFTKAGMGVVHSVAVSPDGKFLLSGSADKLVRRWEIATGKERGLFSGHAKAVTCVAFGSDQRLLSGSMDGTIKVWDAATGAARTINAHPGGVIGLGVSSEGRLVSAGAGKNATVNTWLIETEKPLVTLRGHKGQIAAVAVNPDGNRILTGGLGGVLHLWNPSDHEYAGSLAGADGHTKGVTCVACYKDKLIATAGEDKKINFWEAASGKFLHSLDGHEDVVWSLAFSPDGRFIASTSADHTIRIWKVGAGDKPQILPSLAKNIRAVTFSPDSNFLIYEIEAHKIGFWNIAAEKEDAKKLEGHTLSIASMACSPDHSFLVSGGRDNVLRVWSLVDAPLPPFHQDHKQLALTSVAVSSDSRLIAAASEDNSIRLWNTGTGKLHLKPCKGLAVLSVAFHPDPKQKRLASGHQNGTIKIWDTDTGQDLLTLSAGGPIRQVLFSADGARLFSASGDESVKIWDAGS